MMFKDKEMAEEAQLIIAHVGDLENQSQNPYQLKGSKEKLSDLNKHYYEMVKFS
jgi:hypothetical protein